MVLDQITLNHIIYHSKKSSEKLLLWTGQFEPEFSGQFHLEFAGQLETESDGQFRLNVQAMISTKSKSENIHAMKVRSTIRMSILNSINVLIFLTCAQGCVDGPTPVNQEIKVDEESLSPEVIEFNAITKKAEGGDSNAMVKLAEDYYWQGNKAAEIEANEGKAFGLWYQAAELGNIEACYAVGFCYSRSYQDNKKAVKWYKKASDSGHQLATFRLADLYYSGTDVLKDPEEAISLYQSIVQNNNAKDDIRALSALQLGQIFEDRSERLMENYYYTIAAEGGEPEAMYKVGVIAYEDYPDKGKSAYWIGKAYNDHNYEKAKIFWDAKELWRFGGWAP